MNAEFPYNGGTHPWVCAMDSPPAESEYRKTTLVSAHSTLYGIWFAPNATAIQKTMRRPWHNALPTAWW
ncbi:hypothetical protein GCM10007338_16770 [Corynebacterium pelargi]|nr:hypothetical protein GCM10007338_16770 [Corynebacterium pelargi]